MFTDRIKQVSRCISRSTLKSMRRGGRDLKQIRERRPLTPDGGQTRGGVERSCGAAH